MSKQKIINTSGKRKRSIARATVKEGKGTIKINKIPADLFGEKLVRMKFQELLILAGDYIDKVDINISVDGGGPNSQIEAARVATARALTQFFPKLKKDIVAYDRQFLVADIRRKECAKPNCRGQARSKRQKSYR